MTRQEVIRRLCTLTEEVHDKIIGYSHASDCFCFEGGLWSSKDYSDAAYRNDGACLEWIEKAVNDAIASELSARGGAL